MTVRSEVSQSESAPTQAERDHIVERLQEAVGEGALTLDEFQVRLDAAYSVGTRAEMASLIADLPPTVADENHLSPNRRLLGVTGIAVVVLAATGLTIGLSNRSPKAPTPQASSIVRDVDSCELVSSAQVDAVLGTASVKPPSRYDSSRYGWDVCSYITTSANGPAVDVEAGTAISGFASRYRMTQRDISGIGNRAAIDTNLPGSAILAREGTKWVDVTVEYLPVGVATPDAERLARAALSQLTNQ